MVEQLENVRQEMKLMNIDIHGLCETRWPGNGGFCSNDLFMVYSGDDHHANGVGVIMKPSIAKSAIGCWTLSERVMVVKLKETPENLSVIQACAATSISTKKEFEEFYCQLDQTLPICKSTEVQVVVGDFNAKVGQGSQYSVVESYEVGEKNEHGDVLVE